MGRGGRERERIHSFGVADVQKFFGLRLKL